MIRLLAAAALLLAACQPGVGADPKTDQPAVQTPPRPNLNGLVVMGQISDGRKAFVVPGEPDVDVRLTTDGPDFQVYEVWSGGQATVGVYVGNHAVFPSNTGPPRIDPTDGRAVRPGNAPNPWTRRDQPMEGGAETLWRTPLTWPSEIHVWTIVPGEESKRLAASIRPVTAPA